jgi:hypothetical protein
MKITLLSRFSLLFVVIWGTSFRPIPPQQPEWGFFGHKRINRMAVFTLPPGMMVFFKPNIDYLTDHAADPDMRRYAVNWEAPRHYIDLDEYEGGLDSLPRQWIDALLKYCTIRVTNGSADTVSIFKGIEQQPEPLRAAWKQYFYRQLLPRFSSDDKLLNRDSLQVFLDQNDIAAPDFSTAFFTESLSAHGILPWNLQQMQRRLTQAFRDRDAALILKIAADFGHYIGDAHVPLHTTSNYNGAKTNQSGIHAFWESRIPELFADESYDYLVGKAEYIDNTTNFYWNMVKESHSGVDSVLSIEWALRQKISADRQICPDVRLGVQVLTQCREFARAYQNDMQGMVERRMRAAIHAVASAWYTAWVDAGVPDLSDLRLEISADAAKEAEELRKQYGNGTAKGRKEE